MKSIRMVQLACVMLLFFCCNTWAVAQDPTRFEQEIQPFLDEVPAPHYQATVFAGSSSFRLWEGMKAAFPEEKILNRGFGGSHFSDLYYYKEGLILKYRPARLLIYEGDNDLSAGKAPARVLKDARKLLKAIWAEFPTLPVALVSPKPSIARWHLKESYEKLNALLAREASRDKRLTFLDVWTPALKDGKPDPADFMPDMLHLNERGYQLWKEVIGAWIRQFR